MKKLGLLCLGMLLILGMESAGWSATFTVNSTNDAVDNNLGDGICETATLGECTLRAAIQEANALAGDDTLCQRTRQ